VLEAIRFKPLLGNFNCLLFLAMFNCQSNPLIISKNA